MSQVLEQIACQSSVVVQIRSVFEMTDEKFEQLCRLNPELQIEMTAEGELIIMPPTGGRTGNRNARLTAQVTVWSDEDNTGVSFDSSTVFVLPNGAKRSPDVAWVKRERLAALTDEQKEKFLPLCPELVIELRSPTDSLTELDLKMREYIANGAQLGWLLDPPTRTVFVYRQDGTIEQLKNVAAVSGEPLLQGFTLQLSAIWDTDF